MKLKSHENDEKTDGEANGVQEPLFDGSQPKRKYSPLLMQILACSGSLLITVSSGMSSGYSAILLPQLQRNDSAIKVDDNTASWIASLLILPMAFGCILSGIIMARIGRRQTLIVFAIPFAASWFIITFANSVRMIAIGRILIGFSIGFLKAPSAVYIAETAEPKHRSWLLVTAALAVSIGFLIVHIVGTWLPWKITAAISAVFPLVASFMLTQAPSSPYWLASRGKYAEARAAFYILRGDNDEAREEIASVLNRKYDDPANQWKWKDTVKPEFWKPFFIANLFMFTSQFSGINSIIFYTIKVLQDMLAGQINEYGCLLFVDSARMIVTVFACFLHREYGRKPLIAVSGYGTAIFLIALSGMLYQFGAKNSPSWLLMLMFIGYISFLSFGLAPLPWSMLGELFPMVTRSVGSGITSCNALLFSFIVVKTGPDLFRETGIHGAFFIYGAIAAIGTTLVYCLVPETRGKTLQQIEDLFRGSNTKVNEKEKEKATETETV